MEVIQNAIEDKLIDGLSYKLEKIQHHISLKEIQALFGLLAQMNIHQLESGL